MLKRVSHAECGTQVLIAQREECYYSAVRVDGRDVYGDPDDRKTDLGSVEPIPEAPLWVASRRLQATVTDPLSPDPPERYTHRTNPQRCQETVHGL